MMGLYPEDTNNIRVILEDSQKSICSFEGSLPAKKKILHALAKYCYSLGYSRGYEVGENECLKKYEIPIKYFNWDK